MNNSLSTDPRKIFIKNNCRNYLWMIFERKYSWRGSPWKLIAKLHDNWLRSPWEYFKKHTVIDHEIYEEVFLKNPEF